MIGLIFGETDFPSQILKRIKAKNLRYLIIDLTKNRIFKKDKKSFSFALGQFGKIIKTLKDNKCRKILFAGNVKKPNLSNIKLDLKGIYYIPRIVKGAKIGDAAILKEIIKIFKQEGIKTVSQLSFNPELTLKKGNYSKTKPNIEDKIDIKIAIKKLNKLNKYNFSQGTVVRNRKVIAIEGKGGTQNMLKRCKTKKFRNKRVLVKFPKKKTGS